MDRLTGTSTVLLLPTSILPIWGTTSPTHPMTPLTQTAPAVANVANRIARPWASLSPIERILSLHRIAISPAIPTHMGTAKMAISLNLADAMLPISQNSPGKSYVPYNVYLYGEGGEAGKPGLRTQNTYHFDYCQRVPAYEK